MVCVWVGSGKGSNPPEASTSALQRASGTTHVRAARHSLARLGPAATATAKRSSSARSRHTALGHAPHLQLVPAQQAQLPLQARHLGAQLRILCGSRLQLQLCRQLLGARLRGGRGAAGVGRAAGQQGDAAAGAGGAGSRGAPGRRAPGRRLLAAHLLGAGKQPVPLCQLLLRGGQLQLQPPDRLAALGRPAHGGSGGLEWRDPAGQLPCRA
jgi:hypothetical protein